MRRILVCGNWKMNGSLVSNAKLLAEIEAGLTRSSCEVAACVPAVYIQQCQLALTGSLLGLGAQDVSAHIAGAYTGEISVSMLQDFSCKYVILGHSERRAYHAETDALVALKMQRVIQSGMTPILCVGETLAQREAGQTKTVVCDQMDILLAAIGYADLGKVVIAYEPVWAIGTGKTATPEMAQEVHAILRAKLAQKNAELSQTVRILYGGSMKPDNARELLAMPDIDGGLIGGAALNSTDFLAIVHSA
ncbi:MAG: triose-phosphate isomerase [bacterium]